MRSILKPCADHLRTFLKNNHNIQLKPSHAHELVAAFFGYKSKASMLADTLYSIKYLNHAKIYVLLPSLFIEERKKCLEGLPIDLPDTYTLGEEIFIFLALKGNLSGSFFGSWPHLSEVLTTEYLLKNGNSLLPINIPLSNLSNIFNKPLYEFTPKIEDYDNAVKLTVSNRYYNYNDAFQPIDLEITIKLQRVTGHFGYAEPEISAIPT